MTISRRSFLKGLGVVALTPIIPFKALSKEPECLDCAYNPGLCDTHDDFHTLWGDGRHDDTAALQHLFDGGTVYRPNGTPQTSENGTIYLAGGTYLINNTIVVDHSVRATIESAAFKTTKAAPILYFEAPIDPNTKIQNNIFQGPVHRQMRGPTLASLSNMENIHR